MMSVMIMKSPVYVHESFCDPGNDSRTVCRICLGLLVLDDQLGKFMEFGGELLNLKAALLFCQTYRSRFQLMF